MGHSLRRPLAGQPGVPPPHSTRGWAGASQSPGGHGVPPWGCRLAWRQRDGTRCIPLSQRCHILAWSRFWQPQGARIPARAGPGHRCPGLLREQDTCSSPTPSHGAVPVCPRAGTAPSPARRIRCARTPGRARCQLPPPHTRVLKLCCQCSPTHTHCPRSLLAGLARWRCPRCAAKARSAPSGLSPRSPQLLCPAAHQHVWPLNRGALPKGAIAHPAGLRNVSAMPWPSARSSARGDWHHPTGLGSGRLQ